MKELSKALSIVAVVLAGISFIIPIYGIYTAIIAGIMGLIAVREEPTLGLVALGLNVVNIALLTPSLRAADAINCGVDTLNTVMEGGAASECTSTTYWTHVSIHLVILVIGIALAYMNKNKA